MAKKRATQKRSSAQISDLQGDPLLADVASAGGNAKKGIGKTGVHLRYHKHKEFLALTPEQKDELIKWRSSLLDGNNPSKKGRKNEKKAAKKQVASLVKQQVVEAMKGLVGSTEPVQEEPGNAILSMVQAEVAKHVAQISGAQEGAPAAPVPQVPVHPAAKTVTLRSILRNARNSGGI